MNKKNPFDKYLGKEDHLHLQVVEYLKSQYPSLLWLHAPMEGKRSPFERYKHSLLGGISGCPDILIFRRMPNVSGLAIELKVPPNKPTKEQWDFMNKLAVNSWYCKVCYSFEEAKKSIDDYIEGKMTKPNP